VGERVVQRRDGVGERLRSRALCHEVVGQRLDVRDHALEARDVARQARGLQDVAHRHALQHEQVALGDDPGEPPVAGHHQLVEAELGHLRERFLRGRHLVDGARVARHHRTDRGGEIDAFQHHAAQQVGLGEDPDRALPSIDHGDAAEPLALHHLERGADRRAGLAEDGLAADDVAQRLEQRALLDHPLAEILAQVPERVLHDAREHLRTVLGERRRRLPQRLEVVARQPVAEHVLGGLEAPRAGGAGRERRHREALTRAADFVVAGNGHVVHAHVAALDDVQVVGHPVGRVDDGGPDGEIGELGAPGEELEVLARHARERHVPAQEPDGGFDDQGGCSHGRKLHPPCRH
jgi:hypothetical protein